MPNLRGQEAGGGGGGGGGGKQSVFWGIQTQRIRLSKSTCLLMWLIFNINFSIMMLLIFQVAITIVTTSVKEW